MTPYTKRVYAVTKRMAEDRLIRNMAITTIDSYTYHVDRIAKYFGEQPDSERMQLRIIQAKGHKDRYVRSRRDSCRN